MLNHLPNNFESSFEKLQCIQEQLDFNLNRLDFNLAHFSMKRNRFLLYMCIDIAIAPERQTGESPTINLCNGHSHDTRQTDRRVTYYLSMKWSQP